MKFLALAASILFSGLVHAHGHQHPTPTPTQELIAHLVFPTNNVHAHLSWEKAPTLEDEAILKVEFRNPTDHELKDIAANLSVGVTMPDMDHGDIPTAPPAQVKDDAGNPIVGTYTVGNVFLYMGGRWEISLTLTSDDGTEETQKFDFQMEGQGHH